MSEPRYENGVCLDCGCVIADEWAHTRFHSILASHAWSLAVLKVAHISARTHDKYDVVERIDSKQFDNWSADAFAEVVGGVPAAAPTDDERQRRAFDRFWRDVKGSVPAAAPERTVTRDEAVAAGRPDWEGMPVPAAAPEPTYCAVCGGSGEVRETRCSVCRGSGLVGDEVNITLETMWHGEACPTCGSGARSMPFGACKYEADAWHSVEEGKA